MIKIPEAKRYKQEMGWMEMVETKGSSSTASLWENFAARAIAPSSSAMTVVRQFIVILQRRNKTWSYPWRTWWKTKQRIGDYATRLEITETTSFSYYPFLFALSLFDFPYSTLEPERFFYHQQSNDRMQFSLGENRRPDSLQCSWEDVGSKRDFRPTKPTSLEGSFVAIKCGPRAHMPT